MQLTLVRDLVGSLRPAAARPDVAIRPVAESDLEAVGRLYWSCLPAGEADDEAEAIADVRASWRGEYGTWLRDASLLAEVDGQPLAAVLVVDAPPRNRRLRGRLDFVADLQTGVCRSAG
jgi:hypothetical protein